MAEDHEDEKTLAGLWLKSRTAPKSPSPPRSDAASAKLQPQMDLLFSSTPAAPAKGPLTTGLSKPPSRVRRSNNQPDTPVHIDSQRRIWSVRELVSGIRQQLEQDYQDIWVEGEISNCRPAPSGHVYFTLKDGEAQLPVVLFRREAQLLRFRPQDGLAVLVRGRISVYESRGQLQLVAEAVEPRGAGALQLAFEQLKARLLAEGLFDAARKRPLPAFPRCIGVITSTGGAVLHDIVKVIRRRHARLNLLVYPATMQGPGCAESVAAGIRCFNTRQLNKRQPAKRNATPQIPKADLILIARGGGSIEDLAGFNDEALARAIAASALPVVSAIGHETDFTIADFVADLRAPTPSAAAELITAAQHRIEERVQALDFRVHRAIRYQLILVRQRLTALSFAQIHNRLQAHIGRRAQRLDDLSRRLESAAGRCLRGPAARLTHLAARLERHNPTVHLVLARRRLERAGQSLSRLAVTANAARLARLSHASARLHALSPLAVLSRGYALVYAADGTLLRSAAHTHPGQIVSARLEKGSLTARVETADTE
jgi:exodeoxyribonuclease VII large subunit